MTAIVEDNPACFYRWVFFVYWVKLTVMRLLILLLLIYPSFLIAQDSTELKFEEVISLDTNYKKDLLYLRALQWLAIAYEDSKEVIQLKDPESGIVMGKGVYRFSSKLMGSADTKGVIQHIIKIEVRDGKYRYSIYQFIHKPVDNRLAMGLLTNDEDFPHGKLAVTTLPKWRDKLWHELKQVSTSKTLALAESLKKEMSKPIDNKNW
jgi:hypothetical protein